MQQKKVLRARRASNFSRHLPPFKVKKAFRRSKFPIVLVFTKPHSLNNLNQTLILLYLSLFFAIIIVGWGFFFYAFFDLFTFTKVIPSIADPPVDPTDFEEMDEFLSDLLPDVDTKYYRYFVVFAILSIIIIRSLTKAD